MHKIIFIFAIGLMGSAHALSKPMNVNEPLFDFKTTLPVKVKKSTYIFESDTPVIQTKTEKIETSSVNTPVPLETEIKFQDTTLTFKKGTSELTTDLKIQIANVIGILNKNPKTRVNITTFYTQSESTLKTSESKRLALRRSVEIKNMFKEENIKQNRIFVQIKTNNTDDSALLNIQSL